MKKKKQKQNEKSHQTKNGYCCACDYDIAVMENKIKSQQKKLVEEMVEMCEKMKRTREKTIPIIAKNPRFIETVEQQNIGYNSAFIELVKILKKNKND